MPNADKLPLKFFPKKRSLSAIGIGEVAGKSLVKNPVLCRGKNSGMEVGKKDA